MGASNRISREALEDMLKIVEPIIPETTDKPGHIIHKKQ